MDRGEVKEPGPSLLAGMVAWCMDVLGGGWNASLGHQVHAKTRGKRRKCRFREGRIC